MRAYLDGKVATIATLKTLGAEGRLIFRIYLLQIAVLAGIGVALGLLLGAGVPILFGGVIEAALPFPAEIGLYPMPLLEAAFYGVVTAFLFTLWPLARTEGVRAAALYRGSGRGAVPAARHLWAIAGLAVLLVGGAVWFSGTWELTLGSAGGVIGALIVLAIAALGLRRGARAAARAGLGAGARGAADGAGGHRRPARRGGGGDPVAGAGPFGAGGGGADRRQPARGHRDGPAGAGAELLLRRYSARPDRGLSGTGCRAIRR